MTKTCFPSYIVCTEAIGWGCVDVPGVLLPGTFMYSWTVFMPRMVWPT